MPPGRRERNGVALATSPGPALPPVEVLLPNGTGVVQGRLIRWRQTDQGQWVARVGIEVWGSTSRTGHDGIEVQVLEMDAPSGRVRRVRGATYEAVPRLRFVRRDDGAAQLAPQAPRAGPAAETAPADTGEGRWVAEVMPIGRGLRVHEPGCWAIHGRTGVVMDTELAAKLLRVDPEASPCDVCRALTRFDGAGTTASPSG